MRWLRFTLESRSAIEVCFAGDKATGGGVQRR